MPHSHHNHIFSQRFNPFGGFGFSLSGLIKDGKLHRRRNWELFQHEVRARLAVAENDYKPLLQQWVKDRTSDEGWELIHGRYAWTEIENVLLDVARKTTKVYKRSAIRSIMIESTELDDAGVDQLIDEADPVFTEVIKNNLLFDYDAKMDRALELALIAGGSLIRPWFMDKDNPDKLSMQILTADQFKPFISMGNPTKLDGLKYFISFADSQSYQTDLIRWHVWDMTGDHMEAATGGLVKEAGHVELDENGKVVAEGSEIGSDYPYKNPDGSFFLPFVTVSINTPEDRLFNMGNGVDLFDGTMLASWYAVQKEWLIRNQSHKQFVLSGPGADGVGNQLVDPAHPIVLPKAIGDEMKLVVLDLKTDPVHIEDAIDKVYERLLTRRGLSLEEFRQTAQRQTAEAQRIQERGENDYNLDLQREMRTPEEQFAKAIAIVWNAHNTNKIADGRFLVDYANPIEDDPYTNLAERLDLVSRNVSSNADLVMDFNPDITDIDAAVEVLKRNQEINRLSARFSSTASVGVAVNTPPPVQAGNIEVPVSEPEIESEIT